MSGDEPTPTRQSLDMVLVDEVRAAMARRRVTGLALAASLGMGRQSMQRRLSGATPLLARELIEIAQLLDVPVSTFTDAASSTRTGLAAAG